MLSNKSIYAVGYNRSLAPWTNFVKKKINGKKAKIDMKINAGQLPDAHWLLDEKTCVKPKKIPDIIEEIKSVANIHIQKRGINLKIELDEQCEHIVIASSIFVSSIVK